MGYLLTIHTCLLPEVTFLPRTALVSLFEVNRIQSASSDMAFVTLGLDEYGAWWHERCHSAKMSKFVEGALRVFVSFETLRSDAS